MTTDTLQPEIDNDTAGEGTNTPSVPGKPVPPDLTIRLRTPAEKKEVVDFFLNLHCHGKRTPTPEVIFEIPLQLGLIKLVRTKARRRPKLVWL